jgi:hypothetical protein
MFLNLAKFETRKKFKAVALPKGDDGDFGDKST